MDTNRLITALAEMLQSHHKDLGVSNPVYDMALMDIRHDLERIIRFHFGDEKAEEFKSLSH